MADEIQVDEQVATPEPPVAPDAPAPDATPEKPPRVYSQNEVDEIVGKVKENSRRRREELRRDLDVFKRMALERQPAQQPPQATTPQTQPSDPQRPKQEDFADYNLYIESLAEWKAETKLRERETLRRQEEDRQRQQQQVQQAQRTHTERETAARAKYDDYDEVALNPAVPINEAMAQTIVHSDLGPEMAYYLGQNIPEAKRIAGLPPLAAIKELGKIEAKLEAKAATPAVPKPPPAAPEPITPVGGKATPATTDEPNDKDDIGTWIRKRSKQVHGRR